MSQEGEAPVRPGNNLLQFASDIVASYVSKNPIALSDIPGMIRSVHQALANASRGTSFDETTTPKPAVPIKKSITPDYLICLEDGKQVTMLKRYLRGRYGLTPDQYRTKWGLQLDYPMVAPNYAERRSQLAKQSGLGKKKHPKPAKKRAVRR